jgi:predicted N-acyltransferase
MYCATIDKHMWGKRLLTRKFFEMVFENFPSHVEVVEARKDGRLVAGAFNIRGHNALYGRYWGCFEEHPFLHFNVCLYHSIDECIRRGVDRFEPGAGGEHKLVRGFEPTVTHSGHLFFHPELDRAIRQFIQQERVAIEQGLPQWRLETAFRD